MINRLREQLSSDKSCMACWCQYRDPQVVGAVAQQGFDAIVLDGQHGFHDETSVLSCIPSILLAGKSPVVRIPLDRWDFCERALDYGALGVIAPMINCRKDAEAFVNAAKYLPLGNRSYGPRYAASLFGLRPNEYTTAANQETIAFAQIETREAFENLDDILQVEGLDGILMGPSDFSIFMQGGGLPDAYGPGSIEAVRKIAEKTRNAGKIAAAFTTNSDHAKLVHSFGYRFISLALDSGLIAAGSQNCLDGKAF
ncbi:MAG: aldolase/citrate lyase family protein [Pseudomonadota bacterium]